MTFSIVYYKLRLVVLIGLLTFLRFHVSAQSTRKGISDFELELNLEDRYFFNDGLYANQEQNFISVFAQPEYNLENADGSHSLKVTLFGRYDQHDKNRTHADIRELYYQHVSGNWELSVGLKKVFWGVTESVHLVDIVNQTDQLEGFDGEKKLGQPMVHASYFGSMGSFDFFYFPYSRKRQFPADKGRLRFEAVIDRDDFFIDSDWEQWHPSGAFRWSHYIGPVDFGLSHFYGMGREPLFFIDQEGNFNLFYPIINQSGLDLQLTTGPVLFKVESIYRYAEQQDFVALATGFEYTFGNVGGTGLDIGIIGEYLYDERGDLALSSLDNDIFSGVRLAFNDTQSTDFLAGMIFDLEKSTKIYSIQANRRLGSSFKIGVEANIFNEVSKREFLFPFREDSFLNLNLSKYF